MASAIFRTWASDSMTHGPAIRKSRPPPTCTGPISNELLTVAILSRPAAAWPFPEATTHPKSVIDPGPNAAATTPKAHARGYGEPLDREVCLAVSQFHCRLSGSG